jgi:hypothetical protein
MPGILFRSVPSRATIEGHAIACGTGEQFVWGCAGRFSTTRWSGVFLARIANEWWLGHEHGAPANLSELR